MNTDQTAVNEMMKNFFEQNVPFAKLTGIELLKIGAGSGEARLADRLETKNHLGTQHAGALFTLGEAASGAASVSIFADKIATVSAIISDAVIKYKKSARGSIKAIGKMREPATDVSLKFAQNGDVRFWVDVDLQNEKGDSVAEMAFGWRVKLRS